MSDIPILILSPFEAMQRERDILHQLVIPQLRELARAHDAELRVVDLQWGIAATPDMTDGFLEVVASELSRASIVVALLNGDAGFREDPVEKTIRTLQIYVALMSKSTRLVPLIRHNGETAVVIESRGPYDAPTGEAQTDVALAARLRERGVSISSYSTVDVFPELLMNSVLPILQADYFSKIGSVGRKQPSSIRERIAIALHVKYRASASVQMDSFSQKPWEDLPDSFKEAGLAQADHIIATLMTIGFAITQPRDRSPAVCHFTNAETEILAQLDHERWLQERMATGWSYGPTKDVNRKITPYLLSWESLPDDVKNFGCVAARNIPNILAKVGFEIIRSV